MTNKNKLPSPLLEAATTLDNHFSEMARLSARIETADLQSDSDIEQIKKLMILFTECAQGVSTGLVALSHSLNEARAGAEASATIVSNRAEELDALQTQRQTKLEAFRLLGEKVQGLTASLMDLKNPEGDPKSAENRAKISLRLSDLESQLGPLIDEAQHIKAEAQSAKMTSLEQDAHSLKQSLLALNNKLGTLQLDPPSAEL